MRTRLLPPEAWDRLRGTALEPVLEALRGKREHVDILVAEDDTGAIVGHVVLLSWVHVEGLASTSPQALFQLSQAVSDYCEASGITGVYSNAMTPETERILRWKRGSAVPGTAYIWYPCAPATTLAKESEPCPSPS